MRSHAKFLRAQKLVAEMRRETEDLIALADRTIERDLFLTIGPEGFNGSISYEQAVASEDSDDPEIHVNGTDPFLIMITSGTTGFPKACTIDHETYSLRSINYAMTRGFRHNERALFTLPVHFNAGRGSAMSYLFGWDCLYSGKI